jgi:hypothetical protein
VTSESLVSLSSPNYPSDYNISTECIWNLNSLTGDSGIYGTLYFEWEPEFDIESGNNCEFDAINAYIEGDYTNYHTSYKWYTFCGHDTPQPFGLPGYFNKHFFVYILRFLRQIFLDQNLLVVITDVKHGI